MPYLPLKIWNRKYLGGQSLHIHNKIRTEYQQRGYGKTKTIKKSKGVKKQVGTSSNKEG